MNGIPKIPTPFNEPVLSYAPGTPERGELKRTVKELSGHQLEIPLVIGGKDVHTGRTVHVAMAMRHHHVHRPAGVDVFATDDEGNLELVAGELFHGPFELPPLRGPRGVTQDRLVDGGRDLGNAVHDANLHRRGVVEHSDVIQAMTIHPNTRIGHVHLTVSDLDRALTFYRDVLGFEVTSRYGRDAVFLSAGGYHHHIGRSTWAGRGAPAPAPGTTGLYHFAILYPDRQTLAAAVRRLVEARVPLEGASDHGVSEAIYLRDPDGNGVELYRDRPESEWPRAADGTLVMYTRPLDLEALAAAQ